MTAETGGNIQKVRDAAMSITGLHVTSKITASRSENILGREIN